MAQEHRTFYLDRPLESIFVFCLWERTPQTGWKEGPFSPSIPQLPYTGRYTITSDLWCQLPSLDLLSYLCVSSSALVQWNAVNISFQIRTRLTHSSSFREDSRELKILWNGVAFVIGASWTPMLVCPCVFWCFCLSLLHECCFRTAPFPLRFLPTSPLNPSR